MWQNNPLGCPQPLGSRPLLLGPPLPAKLGVPRGGGQSSRSPGMEPKQPGPPPCSVPAGPHLQRRKRPGGRFPTHFPFEVSVCAPPRASPPTGHLCAAESQRPAQSPAQGAGGQATGPARARRPALTHPVATAQEAAGARGRAWRAVQAGSGSEPTVLGGRGGGAPCSGWLWSCPRL